MSEVRKMEWFKILRDGSVGKSCVVAKMNDAGYFYIEIPSGAHGKTKRIWINRKAVEQEDEQFVVVDKLDYRITEKGNIVLIPGEKNIAIIEAESGYRGHSAINVYSRDGQEVKPIFRGAVYHSPLGRLGVSDIILTELRERDIIKVRRTGRLYGAPAELTFVYSAGALIEYVEEELKNLL